MLIVIIIILLLTATLVVSTGVLENMAYAGLIYYEEKGVEDLATFTVAKDLNALLEVIIIGVCYFLNIIIVFSLLKRNILRLRWDRTFYFVSKIIMDTLN